MKYSHVLQEALNDYNNKIKYYSISYKKWKKNIKYKPNFTKIFWKLSLKKDCDRINNFLFSYLKNNNIYDIDVIDNLCIINTDTLYKICKKLHKKLNISTTDFLNYVINNNRYNFTKCAKLTLI